MSLKFCPVALLLFTFSSIHSFSQLNLFRPEIVGQTPSPLVTTVNKPITIELSNLIVVDADPLPVYPNGFSLEVSNGKNYKVNDATVSPDQNFVGTLEVPVRVSDGKNDSKKFNVRIDVAESGNTAPEITGQAELRIKQGQDLKIELSHLQVTDPDNQYPNDFTLNVFRGNNYTLHGTTITPSPNFTGTLKVPVSVNDGQNDSKVFDLKVEVSKVQNAAPVITGQRSISIVENTSFTIRLSHLQVTDPDNQYPIGFSLHVFPGDNYSVDGTTITPLPNFANKTLSVKVIVNDGINNSAPFDLKIQVVPASSRPIINDQKELTIPEDSLITITLSHLMVTDADNPGYPKGFSLTVLPGDGKTYSVSGNTITPVANLNGFVEVGVKVSDGANTSDEFKLSIFIEPVNDPPEILNLLDTIKTYEPGSDPINVFEELDLKDIDNDHLSMAEIGFRAENFSPVNDELLSSGDSSHIKRIYDPSGILFLVGYASIEEYRSAIRSVQYHYKLTEDENGRPAEIQSGTRTLYISLHDGQSPSQTHELKIEMETDVGLDIPNAFTPNGDLNNDTWQIDATNKDQLDNAVIRVYNKKGLLVYESIGFENEWDGIANGKVLPVDTYYYTIDLNLSYMKKTFKGAVTILH